MPFPLVEKVFFVNYTVFAVKVELSENTLDVVVCFVLVELVL